VADLTAAEDPAEFTDVAVTDKDFSVSYDSGAGQLDFSGKIHNLGTLPTSIVTTS
jgi:hypothetical protein